MKNLAENLRAELGYDATIGAAATVNGATINVKESHEACLFIYAKTVPAGASVEVTLQHSAVASGGMASYATDVLVLANANEGKIHKISSKPTRRNEYVRAIMQNVGTGTAEIVAFWALADRNVPIAEVTDVLRVNADTVDISS